jgi:hypothetical protein
VFFFVLICQCRFEGRTVRVLQDSEVRENTDTTAVDANDSSNKKAIS